MSAGGVSGTICNYSHNRIIQFLSVTAGNSWRALKQLLDKEDEDYGTRMSEN